MTVTEPLFAPSGRFDKSVEYEVFAEIKSLMSWIVKFIFCGRELQNIEKINVFERED